tara:strand:+ start:748 stop:1143 length:396 start_codon:yes stop_codon:yes gene_type:complete
MIFAYVNNTNAGEYVPLKSPVLYYECIACTDTPNINSITYLVYYKPLVTDWVKFKEKDIILELLNIANYKNKKVQLVKPEEFYYAETRLMLVGLLDYPILLDRYGVIKIGSDVYKLATGSRQKLDSILGGN